MSTTLSDLSLPARRAPSLSFAIDRSRLASFGVLCVAILVMGGAGVFLGADGNYDLRNYHFYEGWALLHKSVGFDLAPAQVQSFQHPLHDAMFYLASLPFNDHPLLFTFIWSIPQALAAWMCFHIMRLILPSVGRWRDPLAFAAAIVSGGGAVSIGVIGTSMSEGIPNALNMAAIWLVLSSHALERRGGKTLMRRALAGALAGGAVVLKLTMVPYLIGFVVATTFTALLDRRLRTAHALAAAGGAAALVGAAFGLPWFLAVYRAFGNPLFPYYNTAFRSPLWFDANFIDGRFMPHGLREWLLYPLEWTLRKSRRVSEEPVRDLRLLLALFGALALVADGVLRRRDPVDRDARIDTTWCAVFFLTGYVFWLRTFSILRYASGLELMSGVILVACVAAAVRGRRARGRFATIGAVCLAAGLISTTVCPTWERRRHPGNELVSVHMPTLPGDSTVVFLVATPASYVATVQPASIRYIGTNNSLVQLEAPIGFQTLIEQAIAAAPGPIYGIDKTDAFFGQAEPALVRYHLRRSAECWPIQSNIDNNLRVCRLEREPVETFRETGLHPGATMPHGAL